MSGSSPAFSPGSASRATPAKQSPGARFAARLIRLRHSRGRLFYAVLLAFLTGMAMNGPLDVIFSLAWFFSEGFSAPMWALKPGIVCLSFTLILSLLYAMLWAATTLLALPLRAITEWLATLVFIGAVLNRYAPQIGEAVPHWPFLLAAGGWMLQLVLIKSGLGHRPLPVLTQHHRTRFTLPLPPAEAYERLRARPGRPHWDKGWAELAEVTPGDDSQLRVEVRRRAGNMTLWVRYDEERPGEHLAVAAALTPEELTSRAHGGERLRLSPHGTGGTLVEVHTCAPHTLFTLATGPMEDRISDYWAHAAAQISGRPDGTMAAALLRPAKAKPPKPA
ncbi:hypothetical protein [Vannielia litorea]|uniref:hypothetical protein n=1 Tax=Vannielia litorea TaxID=1217970 RepID=UPI001BD0D635|nr:hypothetical protein [Vannielia litorea]MBS8228049.1 hypothetical protein [Vannielia litorea]